MSDIVSLAKFKEENTPHNSGPAECVGCGHKWICVTPVGNCDHFECPACHLEKGIYAGLVVATGESHFKCQCGSFYFCVTDKKFYCPKCGIEHTEFL